MAGRILVTGGSGFIGSALVWALNLDAIDEAAATYYERFDFKRFTPGGLEMYLPLGTIQQLQLALEASQADAA